MQSKLGNVLLLLINIVIKERQVGSLFTSGLLYNFTQVKVKYVYLTEWNLHLKKIALSLKNAIAKLALI